MTPSKASATNAADPPQYLTLPDVTTPARAFFLDAPRTTHFEEREVPDFSNLPPLGVVVCPRATGICGSDVHLYHHGNIGKAFITSPFVLGHEPSGIIAAIGSAVTKVKVGDRIAIEAGKVDNNCHHCQNGRSEFCLRGTYASADGVDGTIQSYWPMTEDACVLLPATVSLDEGAMIQPLAITVHCVLKTAQIRPNMNVGVFGCGPIGLLHGAVLKAFAARTIVMTDPVASRADFAASYCATHSWTSESVTIRLTDPEQAAHAKFEAAGIRRMMGIAPSEGLDIAFDCSGADEAIQTAIELLNPGGTLILVGYPTENMTRFPLAELIRKGLTIKSTLRYGPGAYQTALDLVTRGVVDVKPMITHHFAFDDAALAYETMISRIGPDGKPALKCIIAGP